MDYLFYDSLPIFEYCNKERKRFSVWVYDGSDIIQVFEQEKPNTREIWFQFYSFSYLYWRLLQNECIEEIKGKSFFNANKVKRFFIEYLLCGTNVENIVFQRQKNGKLKQEVIDKIFRIHPRILRTVLQKCNLFPKEFSDEQKKDIEKQCMKLFGKGESVSNPHPIVLNYCNLVTFWDKLGLNYFDIMKLPYEVFNDLKTMASYDNNFHSQSLKDNK